MYTKQDIKLPAGDRNRRPFLEQQRRIGFFSLFFFLALVAVLCVTMQGVAQGNKPVSQAGLMFNEDDSHWLLITAVSPSTDTFNTARHSRCSAQSQEDCQQPLSCTSTHIYTHKHKRGCIYEDMEVLRSGLHGHTHRHPEA